jgi:aminoglycoside phosphotransferase
MTSQIRTAIENAVTNYHSDASDISIQDVETLQLSTPLPRMSVSWKSNGDLQLAHVLAWTGPADNSHEIRILESLSHTEIPVPELMTAGTSGDISVMLAAQVDGDSVAHMLANIRMRWEISTIAFSYARMLAKLHALDWTKVTPWMADPESIPEDIIDEQVEAEFHRWESNADFVPEEWVSFVRNTLDWLDLRRPVEGSLCLCHGNFHPANIFALDETVTAVTNWQRAGVRDASSDLAMLPVWLRDVGLSVEDAELFAQAANGAYLQASPRGLANTPFYSVAIPLDQLIDRLLDEERPPSADELQNLQGTIERAIALAGRVPWKNR